MATDRLWTICLGLTLLFLASTPAVSQEKTEKGAAQEKGVGIIELLKLKKTQKAGEKPDDKKSDDKKSDDKKSDDKKTDDKKTDDKKSGVASVRNAIAPADLGAVKELVGKLKLDGVKIEIAPTEVASGSPEEEHDHDAAPDDSEEPPKPEPKRDPLPPMFHMRDGTRLAGIPGTSRIRVDTAYGPLTIPISEVVRVRFAAALDVDLTKTIAALVDQLGNEEFDLREQASEQLVDIGVPALPALRKATGSDDEEIKSRAEKLVSQLEEEVEEPDDEEVHLTPLEGDEDEVETLQFTIKGQVEEKSFIVKTNYGKLEFRREDILSVVFQEPLVTKQTFDVPGNTFAAKNQWVDTGVELRKGESFELTASGTITMANYGNTKCGPEGTTNVSSSMSNMAAGALVGKIDTGKPFLVGSSYEGDGQKGGKLFLGVALKSGTVNGKFEVVLEMKEN